MESNEFTNLSKIQIIENTVNGRGDNFIYLYQ